MGYQRMRKEGIKLRRGRESREQTAESREQRA
jgi:hypothetical protein